MADNEMNDVEALRAHALSDEADDRGDVEFVIHREARFEVRAPTLADVKSIRKVCVDAKGNVDEMRMSILTLVACTFAPGTDKKVFTRADEEKLMTKRPSKNSLVAKLLGALRKVQSVDAETETGE